MNWIPELTITHILVIGLFSSYVLYFLFGKKEELSRHAAENTFATAAVMFGNVLLLAWFVKDIGSFAQSAYAALGIPTIDPATWDNVPIVVVCLFGLAAKDFADYVIHRIMHTRWGWPTHAAHHSDTHVNALSLYRVHILEWLMMHLNYIVLLTWLQMPQAIPVVMLLQTLHGMYVHMDLDFDHGPFKYVIASPVFHRWHHADVPEAYGKNLAGVFPVFDLVFGTYYNPGPCKEKMGALSSGVEDKNPIHIFTYPLREWTRLITIEKSRWAARPSKSRSVPTPKQVKERG